MRRSTELNMFGNINLMHTIFHDLECRATEVIVSLEGKQLRDRKKTNYLYTYIPIKSGGETSCKK